MTPRQMRAHARVWLVLPPILLALLIAALIARAG